MSVIKNTRNIKIQSWALAIIAIVSSMAMYHADTTLVSYAIRSKLPFIIYAAVVILIASFFQETKSFKSFPTLIWCVMIWWLFTTFHVYSNTPIDPRPLYLIILLLFCCLRESVWCEAFKIFRYYLIFTSLYGIISYISFLISLPLPHEQVTYYSNMGENTAFYINYYLSYLVFTDSGIRLCGMFNEPGYFGTILALYLVADDFSLKKKENVIMLLAGIFTFSMAFFAIFILFLIIKIGKTPKVIVPLLFAVVVLWLSLPWLMESNSMVGRLIDRFEFSEGRFAGDNRTTEIFDGYWNRFIRSSSTLFGYGNGFVNYIQSFSNSGSLSYKKVVIEYGIIGAGLMWGLLYKAARIKGRGYNVGLFILLFFVSIYQRPNVIFITYFVLLFGGIEYIKEKLDKNRINSVG